MNDRCFLFTTHKFLSRLKINFSHLNKHKFRHNFNKCVRPIYGCELEIESTQHFFLRCHFNHDERSALLNSLYDKDLAINELNEDSIINLGLFGSDKYHKEKKKKILLHCVTYFKVTKRFDEPFL